MSAVNVSGSHLDDVNRSTFRASHVVDAFRSNDGFLDVGERLALEEVAAEVRGSPVLDLGVGTGRTTSLLALLSDDYVGVDYSSEMVSVCQRLHPAADIRVGDARRLTGVPSDHFALVLFSNNGIDAVDRPGRRDILAECYRVLRPGGVAVIATLNVHGVSFGELPWQMHRPHQPIRIDPKKIAYTIGNTALHPQRRVLSYLNWVRRRKVTAGDGWCYGPLKAHDFGLVVHFTALWRAHQDLADAGLTERTTYACDGRRADDGEELEEADAFVIVASKPLHRAARSSDPPTVPDLR
ncbi:MAG: class I SAM-dependent methyltransferase [Actinomycetota bacterium]|nr:class I SAM-dependent methyltransferase [Actinomycetota bacterium]